MLTNRVLRLPNLVYIVNIQYAIIIHFLQTFVFSVYYDRHKYRYSHGADDPGYQRHDGDFPIGVFFD